MCTLAGGRFSSCSLLRRLDSEEEMMLFGCCVVVGGDDGSFFCLPIMQPGNLRTTSFMDTTDTAEERPLPSYAAPLRRHTAEAEVGKSKKRQQAKKSSAQKGPQASSVCPLSPARSPSLYSRAYLEMLLDLSVYLDLPRFVARGTDVGAV